MLRAQLEWVSEGQTKDIGRARKTAAALVACAVWINAYHADDASIPWGGYKQSGWGRELGIEGGSATIC
jgi:phenylacetaldehyde dehydrogenase